MKNLTKYFVLTVLVSFFATGFFLSGKDNLDNNSPNSGINNKKELPEVITLEKNELGKYVPISGNVGELKNFFESLKETNTKKIRVIHYGDSQIQADIITEFIRENLQKMYGGKGAGYLSIVSNDIKMRMTTEHSFSDDWNFASIITRNPDRLPFGVSGSVAIPKPGSWVNYKCMPYLESTSMFEIAKLYYSGADESSTIKYSINNGPAVTATLEKGEHVHQLIIDGKTIGNELRITFVSGKEPYFYGVSLETGNGIYVDNFPMPGNTGASLLEIPSNVLSDFNSLSDYRLVILSYGNNVSSPNRGIFTVYQNKMLQVIKHLRTAFPKASFLMFSVNDKTVKHNNRFVTNPDVPMLLDTQKKIVNKTKVAFWNLWEAMGGTNSMNEWVNAAPPMALKDFSHFTQEGGHRVADLFVKALTDAKSSYGK